MSQRAREVEGRVVVVSMDDAATLDDCLEGIAEATPAGVEVVVVDLESSDDSADVAIRHPRVDRVHVAPRAELDVVLDADVAEVRRLAIVRGDRRPCASWLDAAFGTLERADLAHGPSCDPFNLALDLRALQSVSLFSGTRSMKEVVQRARLAGAVCAPSPGMTVTRAARSAVRRPSLPVRPPLPGSSRRMDGLITVVLCTRDRPRQLERCLASLAQLDDDDHEILVVDNHDRPAVDPAAVPPRGRVVHEPRTGLDVARNRGITEAAGDVVAFIDDDCEADPRWLDGLRCAFADPAVAIVTGRVRPASLAQPSQRYFESYFSFDRGTLRRRFTPWDRRPFYPLWPGPLGTGCNMAMRRPLLEEVGAFDEALDMGSSIGGGGDLDMFARFLDRGLVAEYTPDALVWHHHRADMTDLTSQFLGYGESVGATLLKAVLDRPEQRVRAGLFYWRWLKVRGQVAHQIRHGRHVLPMRLLLTDLRGGLRGPFLYAIARVRARLRPRLRARRR
jgi:GT2 family glycosyltransferase